MAGSSVVFAAGVLFHLAILTARAQNGGAVGSIISNSDASITYSPEVCSSANVEDCYGAWWDTNLDNGDIVKTTAGPGSAYGNVQTYLVQLFYGTALEVHGLRDAAGAIMTLQLDNQTVSVNTSTGNNGGTQIPSLLASFENLENSAVHTLTIGWSSNNVNGDNSSHSYTYFDHLTITGFRAVQNSSSASSQAVPTVSSVQISSKDPARLSPGGIAGIVIAVLLFFGILASASYWVLRRRRYLFGWRGYHSRRVNVITTPRKEPWSNGPPSPASSSVNARPHLSLPPAYLAEWQDGQYTLGDGKGMKSAPEGMSRRENIFDDMSYLHLESGSGGIGSAKEATSFASDIAEAARSLDGESSIGSRYEEQGKTERLSEGATYDHFLPSINPATPPPARLAGNKHHHVPVPSNDLITSSSPIKRMSHFSVREVKRMKASRKSVRIIQTGTLFDHMRTHPSNSTSSTLQDKILPPPIPPLPSQPKNYLGPSEPIRFSSAANDVFSERPSASRSPDGAVELLTIDAGLSSFNSRSSFTGVSVRSLPPPYALHP